jgi:glycerophosphoryl diester phosphodiesterase
VVGISGRVEEYTADELAAMSLSGTKDGVPKFSEVLKTVGGRVPLLIEIKEMPGNSEVSAATVEALKEYDGPYVIESFNPLSLRTVARKAPKVARGILSHRYYAYEQYKKRVDKGIAPRFEGLGLSELKKRIKKNKRKKRIALIFRGVILKPFIRKKEK